jgi:hypothetical protein
MQKNIIKPSKKGVQRYQGRSRSPKFNNNATEYMDYETEEPYGGTDLVDQDLRIKQKVLKPIIPQKGGIDDHESPRPRHNASPTPASRNPTHDNPTMYDKLAKKIRQQAKRIIELES